MKTYTYLVACSITVQYTFAEEDLERTAPSDESARVPTSTALLNLANEFEAQLGQNYAVSACSIEAESLVLLGVNSD
jgi:hypothetical protein